jgi:hypothetical protein
MNRRDLRTPYPFHALPGRGQGYRPAPAPVRVSFWSVLGRIAMICAAIIVGAEFAFAIAGAFIR